MGFGVMGGAGGWKTALVCVALLAATACWVVLAGFWSSSPSHDERKVDAGPSAVIRKEPSIADRSVVPPTADPDQPAQPSGAAPSNSFVAYATDVIRGKFRARPGERYSVQNVAQSFADLARRAELGDLQAARTLLEDLRACSVVPRNQEALGLRLENERRRFAERGGDPERHETTLAVTREMYRHCAGVTEKHLAQLARFAKMLADAGSSQARLDYLWDARPKTGDGRLAERLPAFREQGLRYLQDELALGNSRALASLSSAYADPGLGIQDPRRQYVYGYAYAQTPGLHPHDPIYVGLAGLTQRFTPAEIAELQREGVALYATCCRR
jgi:hypothetical protein